MKRTTFAAALAIGLCPALPAAAGFVPTTVQTTRHDNKVFVGLNWNFGVRNGLTAVVGYRYAYVSGSNHLAGGIVDLTAPLTGAAFQLGEVHLKGMLGTRSVQGEGGVGYGFEAAAFLVNGGVRVPYGNAGVDYLFGKGLQPYVGIDSLKRAKGLNTTTSICPPGDIPNFDDPSNIPNFDDPSNPCGF